MKIIDVEEGLICAAHCWDIYTEALALFLNKLPEMIADIANSLEAEDFEKVRRLSHSLRGMSGTVGAIALQEQAKQMEQAVLNQECDLLTALFETLKELVVQVQQAVSILLHEAQALIDDGHNDRVDH